MQLRAEEISQIIKKQIASYEKTVEVQETGTVLTIGDGIARVYGLEGAMAGELVEFPGELMGMILNLEEDNVGVALLGSDQKVREGDTCRQIVDWSYDPAPLMQALAQREPMPDRADPDLHRTEVSGELPHLFEIKRLARDSANERSKFQTALTRGSL